MNSFGFRHTKHAGQFLAEYRLAHWSGWKTVRDERGEPIPFSHASDAERYAAHELCKALNGNSTWWRGKSGDEARQAAEKLFSKGAANGETGA